MAFLDSGLEYEWPPALQAPLSLAFLRLVRLRKKVEQRERQALDKLRALGDWEVWPFVRKSDYRRFAYGGHRRTDPRTDRLKLETPDWLRQATEHGRNSRHPEDAQSWNAYEYSRNHPLTSIPTVEIIKYVRAREIAGI
jgi:hypothetical protein